MPPKIDAWLGQIFSPDRIDETCASIAAADATSDTIDQARLKMTLRECDVKLARYRKALEAGTDPSIVAAWIDEVTGERRAAEAELDARPTAVTLTADQVRSHVEEIGGLVPLLAHTDLSLRTMFYEELGLEAMLDPKAQVIDIEARVPSVRVGGGT